jgi:hypothetical protein
MSVPFPPEYGYLETGWTDLLPMSFWSLMRGIGPPVSYPAVRQAIPPQLFGLSHHTCEFRDPEKSYMYTCTRKRSAYSLSTS